MRAPTAVEAPDWRDEIFAALKAAEVRQVGYVPDAGHARLIELCHDDPGIRAVPLTTDEEGVALAAGAWLGGQRAALLMQSSGVGNCINMLSLTKTCRFPLVMLVAMRGEWAEFNPWQVPMGSRTQAALELYDVLVYRVERPEEAAETVTAALDRGSHCSSSAGAETNRRETVGEMIANDPNLDRRAAMRTLLENRGDLLLVTGLGSTTWDAAAVGDDDRNFYLWGAMGAAAMIGLGLAIAQPERRVLVVTGDGEMLMGLVRSRRSQCSGHRTWQSRCSTTATTARPGCRRATRLKLSNSSRSPAPAASKRHSTSSTNSDCATSPTRFTMRRPHCSPASRSAPTNRRGYCRRAMGSC